jgi:hypothetical protein
MSELSERGWHAEWMANIEYALWDAVERGPRDCGQLRLTEEHIARLRELSAACAGWIRFDDTIGDEVFVLLETWKRHVAERTADGPRGES